MPTASRKHHVDQGFEVRLVEVSYALGNDINQIFTSRRTLLCKRFLQSVDPAKEIVLCFDLADGPAVIADLGELCAERIGPERHAINVGVAPLPDRFAT